jgi:hypothetical protein
MQVLQGLISTLIISLAIVFPVNAKNQVPVFGWIEEALLLPEKVPAKVKFDSGALTSSIDAKDLRRFNKDGEKWVEYTVEIKDSDTGKKTRIPFSRRVERFVKIRGAGGIDHRMVVMMEICLGTQRYTEQFSLNNRAKMLYPILLGRQTIEHLGLIDVTRTFTIKPKCAAD